MRTANKQINQFTKHSPPCSAVRTDQLALSEDQLRQNHRAGKFSAALCITFFTVAIIALAVFSGCATTGKTAVAGTAAKRDTREQVRSEKRVTSDAPFTETERMMLSQAVKTDEAAVDLLKQLISINSVNPGIEAYNDITRRIVPFSEYGYRRENPPDSQQPQRQDQSQSQEQDLHQVQHQDYQNQVQELSQHRDQKEIMLFCESYLNEHDISTELIPVETGSGVLYSLAGVLEGERAGTDDGDYSGKTLMFCGHLDTVPFNADLWDDDKPPLGGAGFAGTASSTDEDAEEAAIFGRGALDMKGGDAAMMSAMTFLADQGAPFCGNLMILLTPDEESAGEFGSGSVPGICPMIQEADMTLIPEPTQISPLQSPAIVYGEKGPVWIKLHFNGESGHSSNPKAGRDALSKALRFADQIHRMKLPRGERPRLISLAGGMLSRYSLGDLIRALSEQVEGGSSIKTLTDSTVCFTGLKSGSDTVINQIPAEAVLTMDCRMLPGIQVDQFMQALAEYADKLDYSIVFPEGDGGYNGDKVSADAGAGYGSDSNCLSAEKPDIEAEVLFASAGSVESLETQEAALLFDAFEAVFGTKAVSVMSPGFTDAGNLRDAGLRNIFVVGPGGDYAHAPNEFVLTDSMLKVRDLYVLTALRYLQ